MRIYTKTGDAGTTGLYGGERVAKTHTRIEAYGSVDELNSHIGVCVAVLRDEHKTLSAITELCQQLESIQQQLFTLCSHLATPTEEGRAKLPQLHAVWIEEIEQWIDGMEERLPQLKTFILPGGSVAAAQMHVARTVCRRAERAVVATSTATYVDPFVQQYMNRLSDYLFVAARYTNYTLNIADVVWKK